MVAFYLGLYRSGAGGLHAVAGHAYTDSDSCAYSNL